MQLGDFVVGDFVAGGFCRGGILSQGDFVAGGFCHAVPKNCVGCGEKVARHSPTRSK